MSSLGIVPAPESSEGYTELTSGNGTRRFRKHLLSLDPPAGFEWWLDGISGRPI